jgi:prepilin-type N-terminal cleavage/methylation domain-containing protein
MPRRPGFTLIEVITVMAIMGIMMAIAVPRFRRNETQAVVSTAVQLTRDLEAVRARALGARRMVRVSFNETARSYSWIMDVNGDSLFDGTDSSSAGVGMIGSRTLDDAVVFGRPGGAMDLPLYPGNGAIALDSTATITFDDRGLTFPPRTSGAVYLTGTNANAGAAVSISGAGSFRAWQLRNGVWK